MAGLPRNSHADGQAAAGAVVYHRPCLVQPGMVAPEHGQRRGRQRAAATVHVIDRLAGALVAGTVRAAGADAVGLDAVPDDRAAAVVAARRRGMARTFQAVADVP